MYTSIIEYNLLKYNILILTCSNSRAFVFPIHAAVYSEATYGLTQDGNFSTIYSVICFFVEFHMFRTKHFILNSNSAKHSP